LPVPVSPFTAVPVPADRIAFFDEIERPRYTLPPAPVLPQKAARNQSAESSDVTTNKPELPSAAPVPVLKELSDKDTKIKPLPQKDKSSETLSKKEISAEIPSKSPVSKPSAVPAVKPPAAAPALDHGKGAVPDGAILIGLLHSNRFSGADVGAGCTADTNRRCFVKRSTDTFFRAPQHG